MRWLKANFFGDDLSWIKKLATTLYKICKETLKWVF